MPQMTQTERRQLLSCKCVKPALIAQTVDLHNMGHTFHQIAHHLRIRAALAEAIVAEHGIGEDVLAAAAGISAMSIW